MATSKEVAIFFYFWKKVNMKITLEKGNKSYEADLSQPLDISIPLEAGEETVNCFYAPPSLANVTKTQTHVEISNMF